MRKERVHAGLILSAAGLVFSPVNTLSAFF